MNTEIIDYSSVYFIILNRMDIPSERGGKFMCIRHQEEKRYIVFSPSELSKYHANIVERFAKKNDIRGKYDATGERFTLLDSSWMLEGGGLWRADETMGVMELWGASQAYGSADLRMVGEEVLASGRFPAIRDLVFP